MSMQIAKLILYSRQGAIRELKFKLGQLNVLTGASKTGKSAVIDIIDYCTGRSDCNIADGVIRKYVGWFALLLQVGKTQVFIARRNPEVGERTSPDIYMDRGKSIETPANSALFKNTTVAAVESFLSATLGISENEHRPPQPTRDPLEANFRHALLLSLQDQNDIDSKQRLFHRQGEDFIGQAIKDTLPYFLGAIDEDRLLKQSQLDVARRNLRRLERELRDAEVTDTSNYPRASALFDEAKQVGLISERVVATNYANTRRILESVLTNQTSELDSGVPVDGEDLLAGLRAKRQGLRAELERVHAEIRSTRTFTSETTGYEREAKEQRARLSAVGLVHEHDGRQCPVCESHLLDTPPTVKQIQSSLKELAGQLDAVEAENPRLQLRLSSLQGEESAIESLLRENQQLINARLRENEYLRVQQDNFVLRARTVGKITQYLDVAADADTDSTLRTNLETARARVAALEAELDPDDIREKLSTFLNIIGRYMTEYSEELELEQRGSQLRLDIRALTVVADTLDGPVPLSRMGSGENWVGYHVLAHLALHKWFRLKNRPVPGFIIFDQPSQAHYPPENDAEGSLDFLKDEDQTAVLELFELMSNAAKELAPNLQVIVLDHADLKQDWFRASVVERWRKGEKLVPPSWIQ